MKPANFPGRKNARRSRAVVRMALPETLSRAEKLESPYYITLGRIIPDDMARAIRTKKDRSARGKIRG